MSQIVSTAWGNVTTFRLQPYFVTDLYGYIVDAIRNIIAPTLLFKPKEVWQNWKDVAISVNVLEDQDIREAIEIIKERDVHQQNEIVDSEPTSY